MQKRVRVLFSKMKLHLIAAAAASVFAPAAALAGPYVNIENNAGFTGSDYNGNTTDFHVGYEGDLGSNAAYYIQGGPAVVAADGADTETELSGKAGVGVGLTEKLSAYGEVSFITGDDDNSYGTKLGLKYNF